MMLFNPKEKLGISATSLLSASKNSLTVVRIFGKISLKKFSEVLLPLFCSEFVKLESLSLQLFGSSPHDEVLA
jgi:hypothetical protein